MLITSSATACLLASRIQQWQPRMCVWLCVSVCVLLTPPNSIQLILIRCDCCHPSQWWWWYLGFTQLHPCVTKLVSPCGFLAGREDQSAVCVKKVGDGLVTVETLRELCHVLSVRH